MSDNDRVLALSENFENKQNIQKNVSKVRENQFVRNALNNPEISVKEKEVSEAGRSLSNTHKANVKTKAHDKYPNEVNKRFYGAKDVKASLDNEVIVKNSSSKNKSKIRAPVSTNRRNSTDQHNPSIQDSLMKNCPECGEDFPSEELLALHNCNVNYESGAESDDNDNFINPLSLVDISLSEPIKETSEAQSIGDDVSSSAEHNQDKHSGKNVSVTSWKCLICDEYFKSMSELKQHYNNPESSCSQADVKLECEVCKCKFETKNDLADHLAVHMDTDMNNSEIDKCRQCDQHYEREKHECDQKEEFAGEEEGQYSCSKCEQTFEDRELFEKHEFVHNQQDLYNSIVTPQFTTFEGIEDLEDFAEENDQLDDEKRPQNVVRCFRCGKLFNSLDELESHEMLKHKNPTPFFCRKCDLRFSARSQLLMHVRSHMRKSSGPESNASNNSCGICNAKFFLPSDLQSHLKMHKYSPDELPIPPPPTQRSWQSPDPYGDNKIDLFARFKCSVCSKIFVHSGSIIRHGKNLHKGQTVQPLRLKRPIFLMKRARSLTLPSEKNSKMAQISKQPNSTTANSQQPQEENCEMEVSQEPKWDQDPDSLKTDPILDFGTEKCPFCEKVFKPTYLPRHIKRNHRGEVLDPQMLGRDIPDDSLVCRYCLKSCSNPHNRRVHESIHYPVKMQCTQCKICGQKFYNKSSYEVHILSCKSVRCGKCNKIFFRYLSLKSHSCIVTISAEEKV